jgi:hypothetical protein
MLLRVRAVAHPGVRTVHSQPSGPSSFLATIKQELHAYRRGFSLFGKDVRLAGHFLHSVPHSLRDVKRRSQHVGKTAKDLLKCVPLIVLIIAPGGGVILPIMVRAVDLPVSWRQCNRTAAPSGSHCSSKSLFERNDTLTDVSCIQYALKCW